MMIGPIGPGGLEVTMAVSTARHSYSVAFAPLSWAIGVAIFETQADVRVALLQIGPLKCVVNNTIWAT
jgi:hypothetical protein